MFISCGAAAAGREALITITGRLGPAAAARAIRRNGRKFDGSPASARKIELTTSACF